MYQVKVEKARLLGVLKENRANHRAIFEKAQEVYRDKMVEELDRMIAEAKRGDKIRRAFSLPEPEDHTDDYDRAIGMLGMSVDDTVDLTLDEYRQYVEDEWGWQRSFASNTASYVATNR